MQPWKVPPHRCGHGILYNLSSQEAVVVPDGSSDVDPSEQIEEPDLLVNSSDAEETSVSESQAHIQNIMMSDDDDTGILTRSRARGLVQLPDDYDASSIACM